MTDIGIRLEQRRADVARIEEAAGGIYTCRFYIDVTQPGDGSIVVNFPVRFVEKPTLSTGWDMWRNQTLTPGRFPVVHCGVYVWQFGHRPDNGVNFYDGATLAISVDGTPDLALTIHCSFSALGVRPPGGQ